MIAEEGEFNMNQSSTRPCPDCCTALLNRRPGSIFLSGLVGGGYFTTCETCDGQGSVSATPTEKVAGGAVIILEQVPRGASLGSGVARSQAARSQAVRSQAAFDGLDKLVMDRLRPPFSYELIPDALDSLPSHYRIHDANDDAVAFVSSREEGYAKLIVQALNEHFERRK